MINKLMYGLFDALWVFCKWVLIAAGVFVVTFTVLSHPLISIFLVAMFIIVASR